MKFKTIRFDNEHLLSWKTLMIDYIQSENKLEVKIDKLFFSIFFILIFYSISYSQENPIKDLIIYQYSDFKGCVKSISVNNTRYNLYNPISNKKDETGTRLYQELYSENQIRRVRFEYNKSFNEEPYQKTEFDSLGRVELLKRSKNYYYYDLTLKQFFSNQSMYPDTVSLLKNDTINIEKYINYFRDTLVVKQEYYLRDTLRTFLIFEYDSLDRLIKKIDVNTKNGFGITLDKSFTGDKTVKHLNPNDTTYYKHTMEGDSTVISEYRNGDLQEVKKKYKSHDFYIKVVEDVGFSNSSYLNHYFSSKDSLSHRVRYIDRNGKVEHDIKTVTYISVNEYDKVGNWIKKTFVKDGKIDRVVKREIKYYCE